MLEAIKTRFQQLAEAVTGPPSRDALAAERDALLGSVPPAPESMLTPPSPPACPCPHCTERASAEQTLRVTFASWASRLAAVERGLTSLTFGDETERDETGTALAGLYHEVLAAIEVTKARPWERRVTFDARGRAVGAWETAPALGIVLGELIGLGRTARERLLFLPRAELVEAIAATRAAMGELLVRPLERPLAPEVAARAGTTGRPPTEAERAGLAPGAAGDPSILSGTIKFSQKGRA